MALHQIVMHCQCGHSKTWTHECTAAILPWPNDPPLDKDGIR